MHLHLGIARELTLDTIVQWIRVPTSGRIAYPLRMPHEAVAIDASVAKLLTDYCTHTVQASRRGHDVYGSADEPTKGINRCLTGIY